MVFLDVILDAGQKYLSHHCSISSLEYLLSKTGSCFIHSNIFTKYCHCVSISTTFLPFSILPKESKTPLRFSSFFRYSTKGFFQSFWLSNKTDKASGHP